MPFQIITVIQATDANCFIVIVYNKNVILTLSPSFNLTILRKHG